MTANWLGGGKVALLNWVARPHEKRSDVKRKEGTGEKEETCLVLVLNQKKSVLKKKPGAREPMRKKGKVGGKGQVNLIIKNLGAEGGGGVLNG